MTPYTLNQLCSVVGGQWLTAAPSTNVWIAAICTNSRAMDKQSLFVAIRGDSFDGHGFIPAAAAAGAVAVLVDHAPSIFHPNLHYLQVDQTRIALGKLARFVRQNLPSKVIAVAGSNGKTGTKYLIDSVLRSTLRGSMAPKSFNNDIGVPLAIFAAGASDDYLVLEIGTNHPGEIANLAQIALPDIAVITNCAAEHLEGLGDLGGVIHENSAILTGLRPDGVLIINGDDPDVRQATRAHQGPTITFGLSSDNTWQATDISCTAAGTKFTLNNDAQVFIPQLGQHNAVNALAAIAIATHLGLSLDRAIAALATAASPQMRLQLQQVAGISILNDAYNANPASMHAALDTLCALPTDGRRVAVLGEMRELGSWTEHFHREIGQHAAKIALDALVCVGPDAKFLAQSAMESGMEKSHITHYPDTQSAAAITHWLRAGDLVLLKASRAVGLDKLIQSISTADTTAMRAAG